MSKIEIKTILGMYFHSFLWIRGDGAMTMPCGVPGDDIDIRLLKGLSLEIQPIRKSLLVIGSTVLGVPIS
ncbi:hypothetical protein [Mycoplana rhizolycopersici]|uniref:Uncharacterized protein n=1 Tax=Mycoplana rhizolycopersici TaxID=2746702 RepID=A0ABX2QK89_9HYPH|nr:hypothetical protein [Rhizobium rhizolycopersici]NVP58210.1 hypothetical protein [Rhizobium rhizolycopersici]